MNIITDEEIEELPLPTIDFEGRVELPKKLGRPKEAKNIPRLVEEIAAVETNSGVDQIDVARALGITQTSAHNAEKGIDRSNIDDRKEDTDLKTLGQQVKYKITDLATTKLMEGLGIFQMESLEQKEIPGAALK